MNVWIMNIMEQYRWTVVCIFHYESRFSSVLWTLNQIQHPFLIFVMDRLDEQPSSGWRPQLSTLQFQMLLQNLTTLKIRATFGQGHFFLEYNFLLLSSFWKKNVNSIFSSSFKIAFILSNQAFLSLHLCRPPHMHFLQMIFIAPCLFRTWLSW